MNEKEWDRLEKEIINCKKCNLWKTRNNPVIGEGSRTAHVLFIGEAPGYWEDVKGRPFVGKAGKILDELLKSIDIDREKVYIANVLKCRPSGNRNPSQTEIESCVPYLDRQIEMINPKIIVTLGNFALLYIAGKFGLKQENIGRIHGKTFKIKTLFGDMTVVPLYHPAAAVYNPSLKKTLLEDIGVVKRLL
ncbi:MAG: uracil-DNA glycosylase family protein [Candidatus Njordarchaeota archaeon]